MCFLNLTKIASDQASMTWTRPFTQSITSSHYHQTATSSRHIAIDRSRSRSPWPLEERSLRWEISRVSPGDRNIHPTSLVGPLGRSLLVVVAADMELLLGPLEE
jgi:hypothetical protein